MDKRIKIRLEEKKEPFRHQLNDLLLRIEYQLLMFMIRLKKSPFKIHLLQFDGGKYSFLHVRTFFHLSVRGSKYFGEDYFYLERHIMRLIAIVTWV